MKVYTDPRTNIVYASYYMHGLYQLAGRSNVRFSMKPFRQLPRRDGIEDFDQYFAFTVREDGRELKVVIDFRDKAHINRTALGWCDIYGKVNFNSAEIAKSGFAEPDKRKILPVGTNFGIRLWSHVTSAWYFVTNYIRSGFKPGVSFSRFLQGYKWQMTRAGITEYVPAHASGNYVFFISTLWKNDKNNDECNRLRAEYIRSCRQANLQFEGGLFTKNISGQNGYSDIVTDKFVHHSEFTDKIRQSMVVFNTPAVWGCHGWKLGEFLAMGKAIISSPFQNEMPGELVHGKNIHFVNNEKELREAVEKLATDAEYRNRLENGATKYYRENVEPVAIVARLIGARVAN